jgi:two-component system chemotaxis sensor kinase CheA
MKIEQAQQGYLAECHELLQEMESALLQLEIDPNDIDMINDVFRSAHTIKGTGGVFGYDDVVSFTHVVESVLDKIRAGDIDISSDLIALILMSRDQIELLVESAVANEVLSSEVIDHNQEIATMLSEYLQNDMSDDDKVEQHTEPTSEPEIHTAECVENENWHISLRFNRDILQNGIDPASLLRYLTRLGDLVHVETLFDESLDIESANPEECLFGLEISFSTDANKEEIEQAFEFFIEDCSLQIIPPKASIDEYIKLISSLPENNQRVGEILLASGSITERELNKALDTQTEQAFATRSGGEVDKVGQILVDDNAVEERVVEAAVAKQQQIKSGAVAGARMLRIDADKLDKLVNLVGEMVIAGARTNLIAKGLDDDYLIESMSDMSRLVEEIRDNALRLRMVQIGETFNRFKRVVRDVGKEMGKDINLKIKGADTELDKTVVEKVGDPLMHLVRNAMDHGIESSDERRAHGKPENGTLQLNAYHDSGSIVIEVIDDGRGLNYDAIMKKALEEELIADTHNLTEQEINRLIFEPGFSTATAVTNLSGRGVGMDVVRKNIEALRGTIELDSQPGVGTKISIRLPLTLAIIDGFLVGVGQSSYVVPLDMVIECVELTDKEIEQARRQRYINLRDEVLPLLRLRDRFNIVDECGSRENIVVVRHGGIKVGLVVDELRGEFQAVIKPLGRIFQGLKGVSGSTILGSGEVAVILDVPGLVQQEAETGGRYMTANQGVSEESVRH